MGTKVQNKSYLPGYHSMRDLDEDTNSFNWPLYYGDKASSNRQYYNGFLPRVSDSCQGYDKDVVKRTMLEHEAIFKNQVYELHRVYRIQRNLMDEIKRKELHQNRVPFETSLSSSPLASQVTSEDARKWNINIPSLPLSNSNSARPSVSGAEDTHSPYSHLKVPFPSQNGGSSKSKDVVEVMESRPTKVRRKMFDLHLPADEYIDDTEEGEQLKNEKSSKINGNHNVAAEGSVKLFLGDASRSDSSLRSTNGLADLNEPAMVEESNPPAYVDLMSTSCDREIRGHEMSAKTNSHFFGTPKEISMNSHIGSSNFYMENGNGRMWFHNVQETGQSKNSHMSTSSQGFNPGKLSMSSQPVQALHNKAQERPKFQTDQSKIDLCRDRTNNGLDSFVASHKTSLYPPAPSPDLAKSWSQSVSSWEKPNSSLGQRSMPVQSHPSLNISSYTLSKSSHSPSQSHGVFGDLRSNSRSNPGLGKEFPNQNGFYHGSSSGSKELQVPLSSGSHDYLNCNYGNGVSEHFAAHSSSKYFNSSNCSKSLKGVDLNVVLATSSSNGAVGFVDGERNHKDDFVGLPWLRSKPANKNNESANSSRDLNNWELSFFRSATDQLSCKSNTGKSPNQLFPQNNIHSLASSNDAAGVSAEIADRANKKKILGFPILEKPRSSEKEFSETVETNKKSRLLDINLPCDAVEENPVTEKRTGEKVSGFRCLIDLNSCLSEDEAPSIPFGQSSKAKTMPQIDLEVSPVPETEEGVNQKETPQLQNEHDELKMAAEAILDISSVVHKSTIDEPRNSLSCASMADPLNWFVEIACANDMESKFDPFEDSSSEVEEVDYFESMTLKLTETKAEEYMPEPHIIDSSQPEETGGSLLTTRPRRGQARRGRPRRDFQRDILPGLTSLSRHEVTEDLQTFGGMMRATGHSWQSGLARRNSGRNGSGRGRRRKVVSPPPVVVAISACTPEQVNTVEVGVEERSLTGWGKTTRRPRRQRCPAGNLQSLPLS